MSMQRCAGRYAIPVTLALLAGCQGDDLSRRAAQDRPSTDTVIVQGARDSIDNTARGSARPSDALAANRMPAGALPADSVRLAQHGEQLFRTKGCVRCHTIGAGYMDGPDLLGIANRQSYEWIVALLTDTENMIQTDPELQQLRIEHFVDMPNLNLSVDDARALYHHLRAASKAIPR